MARQDILKQVNEIFVEVLDNEGLILTETTQAANVKDWDSLNHIQLIVAIEKHFNIRFKAKEIQSWANVGEMINSIEEKQK